MSWRLCFCVLTLFLGSLIAHGADPIFLWPGGEESPHYDQKLKSPTITLYRPEKPNGCAVVVCPGGGYGGLAKDHEGVQFGEWFQEFGVTAVVLHYRHTKNHPHPAPLNDVQRAIRTVRANAKAWGIDPHRVGVMGFSAGGHLASTAATHFDAGQGDDEDPVERFSCRPDFAILCYPVITFTQDFMHRGSRNNLIGTDPDPKLIAHLSNELQVTEQTPPTFLFHTWEDKAVPPQNSIVFYRAMVDQGVQGELHIYAKGRHGVGLARDIPGTNEWSNVLKSWLKTSGYLGE